MANLLLKMLAKKQTPILSLTEQVIGMADMGEILSVVEKCDTTNLVTIFRWDGEEPGVWD